MSFETGSSVGTPPAGVLSKCSMCIQQFRRNQEGNASLQSGEYMLSPCRQFEAYPFISENHRNIGLHYIYFSNMTTEWFHGIRNSFHFLIIVITQGSVYTNFRGKVRSRCVLFCVRARGGREHSVGKQSTKLIFLTL